MKRLVLIAMALGAMLVLSGGGKAPGVAAQNPSLECMPLHDGGWQCGADNTCQPVSCPWWPCPVSCGVINGDCCTIYR